MCLLSPGRHPPAEFNAAARLCSCFVPEREALVRAQLLLPTHCLAIPIVIKTCVSTAANIVVETLYPTL